MVKMGISSRSKPVRINKAPYRLIMPALAGSILGAASLLPWLSDPLGKQFSAWQLPVDIGWQLRSSIFNYGMLSCCEALVAFWIAIQAWITLRTEKETSAKIRERSSQ